MILIHLFIFYSNTCHFRSTNIITNVIIYLCNTHVNTEYTPLVSSYETQLVSLLDHTILYPSTTWWIVHTVPHYHTPYHTGHVLSLLSPIETPSLYRIHPLALNHHVCNPSLITERCVASRRYNTNVLVNQIQTLHTTPTTVRQYITCCLLTQCANTPRSHFYHHTIFNTHVSLKLLTLPSLTNTFYHYHSPLTRTHRTLTLLLQYIHISK